MLTKNPFWEKFKPIEEDTASHLDDDAYLEDEAYDMYREFDEAYAMHRKCNVKFKMLVDSMLRQGCEEFKGVKNNVNAIKK